MRNFVKVFSGFVLACGAVMLIGCGGGSMSAGGSSQPVESARPFADCPDNGAAGQDVAGQCRGAPTTMGALEADDVTGG